MARGRMINRTVGSDKKLSEFGKEAGPWGLVFHHRLQAFLDRNGNTDVNPHFLKGNLFMHDDGVNSDDCRRFTGLLENYGLAITYKSENGGEYLHSPTFLSEQVGLRRDREKDEFPVYTGNFPENCGNESGTNTDTSRNDSGKTAEKSPQKRSLTRTEKKKNLASSVADGKQKNSQAKNIQPYQNSEIVQKRIELADEIFQTKGAVTNE